MVTTSLRSRISFVTFRYKRNGLDLTHPALRAPLRGGEGCSSRRVHSQPSEIGKFEASKSLSQAWERDLGRGPNWVKKYFANSVRWRFNLLLLFLRFFKVSQLTPHA